MCANTLSLGIMFKKIAPRQIWRVCLIQRQIRVIFGVGFERGQVYLKKAMYAADSVGLCLLLYTQFQLSLKFEPCEPSGTRPQ